MASAANHQITQSGRPVSASQSTTARPAPTVLRITREMIDDTADSIRLQADTLSDLLECRNISDLHRLAVDTAMPDIWISLLTKKDIDDAYEMLQSFSNKQVSYLFEMALKAHIWVRREKPPPEVKKGEEPPAQSGIALSDVYKYDFCDRFVRNTSPEIDDIMIVRGYLDCEHSYNDVIKATGRFIKSKETAIGYWCRTIDSPESARFNLSRIEYLIGQAANLDGVEGSYHSPFDWLILNVDWFMQNGRPSKEYLKILDIFIRANVDISDGLFLIKMNPYLMDYILLLKRTLSFALNRPNFNVNVRNKAKFTLLEHFAAREGEALTVRILINYGADVNLLNIQHHKDAYDRIVYTRLNAFSEVIQADPLPLKNAVALLEGGSEVLSGGFIPLLSVLTKTRINSKADVSDLNFVLQTMLDRGARIADTYPSGDTPLMYARYSTTMRLLLHYAEVQGANIINKANIKGHTAIAKAYFFQCNECVKALLDAGADPSTIFRIVPRGTPSYQTFERSVDIFLASMERRRMGTLNQLDLLEDDFYAIDTIEDKEFSGRLFDMSDDMLIEFIRHLGFGDADKFVGKDKRNMVSHIMLERKSFRIRDELRKQKRP